jgi:hypothetical protein
MYTIVLMPISFILVLMTQIITLVYLGTSFNDKDLKTDDWKRKWLIFFAYFTIVLSLFSPLPTYYSVLSIMSSTITLCYLGTSFGISKNDSIKSNDWKRRWLIVMSFINIVVLSIGVLGYIGIKKSLT